MTMFQRKRIKAIKEEVERQYAAIKARAEGLLDKLKDSKWIALAVVAAIASLWSLF